MLFFAFFNFLLALLAHINKCEYVMISVGV